MLIQLSIYSVCEIPPSDEQTFYHDYKMWYFFISEQKKKDGGAKSVKWISAVTKWAI